MGIFFIIILFPFHWWKKLSSPNERTKKIGTKYCWATRRFNWKRLLLLVWKSVCLLYSNETRELTNIYINYILLRQNNYFLGQTVHILSVHLFKRHFWLYNNITFLIFFSLFGLNKILRIETVILVNLWTFGPLSMLYFFFKPYPLKFIPFLRLVFFSLLLLNLYSINVHKKYFYHYNFFLV